MACKLFVIGRLESVIYDVLFEGYHEPRVSNISNFDLPTARDVSKKMTELANIVLADQNEAAESSVNSLLMMQWGQFLDHDIAHTPAFEEGGFFGHSTPN